MNKIIIVGATSGIGMEVAKRYIELGWSVGVTGRRENLLDDLRSAAPDRVYTERMDVTTEDSSEKLSILIEKMGGVDLFLLSAGIGFQNRALTPDIEHNTAKTNIDGFIRMVVTAFNHFRRNGGGHIAIISSVAGTKGIGSAPAYSATKRFQSTYIDALEQLSRTEQLNISFTDIRPGFVLTDLIEGRSYPMSMTPEPVSRHIVRGLRRKSRVLIIDWRYSILVALWRSIPRWIWVRIPVR